MADREPAVRRVLVGVDGSEASRRALRWASEYSRASGAELEVLTSWQLPTSYGWPMPLPDWDFEAQARQLQDEAIAATLGRQILAGARKRVEQGHPAVVLVAASAQADLLVVGSRGHGEFTGMLLGSVSEHCVAHAHCPVVVTRGERG